MLRQDRNEKKTPTLFFPACVRNLDALSCLRCNILLDWRQCPRASVALSGVLMVLC